LTAVFLFGLVLEEVGELLVWNWDEASLLPEVWCKESVSVVKSLEGSLDEVSESLGASTCLSVNVLNTGELEDLLWYTGSNDTSTSWGWDETYADGTALSSDLGGDCVGSTDLVTPVTSADWNNCELGENDSTTNSSSNFLGALDAETDVSVGVTNKNKSLETCSLTSTSLLLDWHDLDDLILQDAWGEEVVNDLEFLDWEREEVDVFKALDEASLYETTKLGNWNPFAAFLLIPSWALSATSATSTTASSATISTAVAKSTTTTATSETSTTTITSTASSALIG